MVPINSVGMNTWRSALMIPYLIWRVIFTGATIALLVALCILLPRRNMPKNYVYPRVIPVLVVEAVFGIIFIIIVAAVMAVINRGRRQGKKTTYTGTEIRQQIPAQAHAARVVHPAADYYYPGAHNYPGNGYYYSSSTMPNQSTMGGPWVLSGAQYVKGHGQVPPQRKRSLEWWKYNLYLVIFILSL